MADDAQSKIHYDDFIASVQPDPAKPASTIMLSGFIGHGGDGVVRIYPDPSLGTWYDVPETDVVHSMAVPDSKLGGSYVWVRAAADIKPGSVSTDAGSGPGTGSGPGGGSGPGSGSGPGTGSGSGAAVVALAQPTPATHCFICPPHTQQCVQPTPTAHVTLATICTQHCTLPQMGCPPYITQPVICGILPPSIGCTQQGCAPGAQPAAQFAAAAVHPTPTVMPTPATMCFICPPLTQDCTAATVCSQQCTMPLGGCLPPHQTAATVCTQQCTTPLGGCLPPHQTVATVCTQQCTTPLGGCLPPHQTVATVCTQQCTTPLGGCLPVQTAATVCTQQGCAPGAAQPFAAAAAMQPTPSAVNQCGVHTAATICTQPPACHPSVNVICPTPSAVHQCGTQPPACHPSVNVICPTPSAVHQCGVAQAAALQPTPSAVHQCGQTAATVCTQPPACHPSVNMICATPSAVHQCGVFTPFGR